MNTQPERKKTLRADLLELVFRNRNRQYGAYPLRKTMPKRMLASFLIAITLMVVGVEMPRIVARLGLPTVVIEEVEPRDPARDSVKIIIVDIPPARVEPPAQAEAPPAAAPPAAEPPRAAPLIKTEAYLPPVVQPDVIAPPTPPTALDVPTDPNAAVGSTNYAGDVYGIIGGTPGSDGTAVNGTPDGIGSNDGAVEGMDVDQKIGPLNMADFVRSVVYPPAAREAGVRGSVVLRLLVDEDGRIREHRVLQASHPLLADAVTAKLAKLRFTKATQGGRKVQYWVTLPVKFNLQ